VGADFTSGPLWEREALTAAGGAQRRLISLPLFNDVFFQWVMFQAAAAAPAANLSIFLTGTRTREDIDGALLNETNPLWSETASKGGVWPTVPGNSIGSDYLTLGADAAAYAMVVVEPLEDLPEFSLYVSQQARGG